MQFAPGEIVPGLKGSGSLQLIDWAKALDWNNKARKNTQHTSNRVIMFFFIELNFVNGSGIYLSGRERGFGANQTQLTTLKVISNLAIGLHSALGIYSSQNY